MDVIMLLLIFMRTHGRNREILQSIRNFVGKINIIMMTMEMTSKM